MGTGGKVVGIITDRDLRLAADSPFLQHNPKKAFEVLVRRLTINSVPRLWKI